MERQLDYNIFDLLPKAPFTSDYFNTSLNPGFKNGFTDSISPNYIRDGAVYGILQSANFQTGIEGWQIKPNGDVEFNDGVFRGTIQIGGQYITVATTGSIQSAIDTVYAGGGGVVILQSGVHTVASDITLYSNVSLIGQSASASIIDFNGGAYQIKVIGSGAYSTGTVSISNNGTTVTGSGTSWTGNITAGQYIMLSGIWYPVTNVGGNTTLTIGLPYGGPTLSGATYISASIVTSSKIQYLTVKNSTTAAIKTMYTNEFFMDDVEIQASGTAIDMDYCSQSTIINFDSIACTNGVDMNECHFFSMNANGALDNTNNGWTIANSTNLAISSAFVLNCGGDGMNLTSVTDSRIDGVFNENGGQGIEFVSGCNRIFLVNSGIQNNTSDGIKLTATSDNVNIQSSFVIGNGGYGVNISASSCDNAVITGNNFSTNTSGAVNDLGTGTVIRGNVGVDDNSTNAREIVLSLGFGEGTDGSYVLDGTQAAVGGVFSKSGNTYTLLKDVFFETLLVSSGVTLYTNGYRLYCSSSFTNNGTVDNSGTDGTDGTSNTSDTVAGVGGTAGVGGRGNTFPAAPDGKNGGDGRVDSGVGNSGNNGTSVNPSIGVSGSTGGGGGASSSGASSGGTAGVATSENLRIISEASTTPATITSGTPLDFVISRYNVSGATSGTTLSTSAGSGSGGGGSCDNGKASAGGGASGGTGGTIFIASPIIINTGTIIADGGDGGDGGNSVHFSGFNKAGGGGGGASGSGGVIIFMYSIGNYTNTGTVSVAPGTPGTGGTGSDGGGTGTSGTIGLTGKIYEVYLSL